MLIDHVRRSTRSLSFQDVFSKGFDIDMPARHGGVLVTETTALSLTAVWAALRIISEQIGTLERDAITQPAGGLPQILERPDWFDYPNPDDTWVDMMGQAGVSLLRSGNAYVLMSWDGGGVSDLTVLDPAKCWKRRRGVVSVSNPETGEFAEFPDATAYRGTARAAREIVHVRGMTLPGSLEGMSPIQENALALGVALAAQKYGAEFFANDATPSGLIELPVDADLSETGQKALREAWNDLYGSSSRGQRKRVAVLTKGAKFNQLQIPPNEAQFLETRKMGVQEVARIYGIPPHLIADMTNSTGWGTGMIEQNTQFVVQTLRPWIERIEARFSVLVQAETGDRNARLRLNEENLLRGATKDRWDMHRKNVQAGVVTADEARNQEKLPPLPDGLGATPWVPLMLRSPQDEEEERSHSRRLERLEHED